MTTAQQSETVPAAPTHDPKGWARLSNAEVLKIAPIVMPLGWSKDEEEGFCAGFRRCASMLAAPIAQHAPTASDTPFALAPCANIAADSMPTEARQYPDDLAFPAGSWPTSSHETETHFSPDGAFVTTITRTTVEIPKELRKTP